MNNALDSPTVVSSSTGSLQNCIRSQFLIYTCTSTDPVSISMGHSVQCWVHPPALALLPKHWHYMIATRQCCDCFFSPTRESSLLYRESLCLWHFCFQAVQLQLDLLTVRAISFLDHKLPLLSNYDFNFPFTSSNAFGSSSIKPLWAMLLQLLILFGLLAALFLSFVLRDSWKG